ncbi:hypothetical protein GCM10027589_27720 [Actinocorallia lasiicapitis]
MKHTDLVRRLRQIAKEAGLVLKEDGGTNHEKWIAGSATAIVPRHKEVGENLAKKILRDFAADLAEQEAEEEGN